MTQEEKNKIVGIYMGGEFVDNWRFLNKEENPIEPTMVYSCETAPTPTASYNWGLESMQYNSCWSWLMPVVDKVKRIDFNEFAELPIETLQKGMDFYRQLNSSLQKRELNKQEIFDSAFELITWQNSNK